MLVVERVAYEVMMFSVEKCKLKLKPFGYNNKKVDFM